MEVNSNVESVSNLHSNQNDSPSQDTGLVSKDGYKKVSSLTLYMPERINLNRLLLEQPPDFRYDKDNFVYIIHLVTAIPSRKRDMIDAYGGYTPINRKFLQKRIHGYKKYIDYLKSHEVVVERSSYSPGKYSMGLKISPQYESGIVPVEITKWTLIKNILYLNISYNNHVTEEYSYMKKWFNDKIEVNYEEGLTLLDNLCIEESRNPKCSNAIQRLNCRLLPFERLKNRQFDFYVDDTGYRLHTNFTQIMTPLRKFIKYGGKTLCAVDIKNSQLYLSIGLLDDELFVRNNISEMITNPKLTTHRNYPIIVVEKIREIKNKPDVILFKKYVSQGKFYEFFGSKLSESKIIDVIPESELREIAKECSFSAIYGPNSSIGFNKEMKLFKELFPNVFKIYSLIKKGRHNTLAICLQRFEADLVLNDACRKISNERPDVFIATLHDSIITTEDNVVYVRKVLSNVLRTRIGVKPPLKIERWE